MCIFNEKIRFIQFLIEAIMISNLINAIAFDFSSYTWLQSINIYKKKKLKPVIL
jgi:hypothetical protein